MTLSIIIAGIMAAITLVVGFGQPEREPAPGIRRWMWFMVGLGLLEALLMPTWPQRILVWLVLLHVQLSFPPSAHERFLMQVLIVAGGYLALYPFATSGEWVGLVTPFLWLLTGLGVLTGLWSCFALYKALKEPHVYDSYTYYSIGHFKIGLWQYDMLERPPLKYMTAGHLNTNFTQPIVLVFAAAACGLAVTSTPWVWAVLPLILMPVGIHAVVQHMPGQWVVHSFILTCLLATHWYGVQALYVIGAISGLLAIGAYIRYFEPRMDELWWDSGRFFEWWYVLRLWVTCRSWLVCAVGGGIRSWMQASSDLMGIKANAKNDYSAPVFSMAHNEYLQQLFEYGVLGLGVLLWYTYDVLTKAYALHIGLFWVGCLMVSAALITFPWTFYHTVNIENPLGDGRSKITQTRHGSPLFVWLTLLFLLIVEV